MKSTQLLPLRAILYRPVVSQSSRCRYSTTSTPQSDSPFRSGPAPPRLPESEQKIFEELQRRSTGAFSTPRTAEGEGEGDEIDSLTTSSAQSLPRSRPDVNQVLLKGSEAEVQTREGEAIPDVNAKVTARGEGDELHPDVRRGAGPEFEGERNPQTGEVGGPKNDPLRWGGQVDWSFNGRVTDF